MTTMKNTGLTKTFIAANAIPRYRVVKLDSAENSVALATAATDRLIGVTAEPVDTPAGARIDVTFDGIAEVQAGAAVNKGAEVTSDATGRVITATSTDEVIGYTFEAANAAGDVISIRLKD